MAHLKENYAHDDEAQSPPEYWSVKLRELRQELETYKGAQALDEAGQHTKDDSAKRIGELYKELAEVGFEIDLRINHEIPRVQTQQQYVRAIAFGKLILIKLILVMYLVRMLNKPLPVD